MNLSNYDAAIVDLEVPGAEELAAWLENCLPLIVISAPGDARRKVFSLAISGSSRSIRESLEAALLPKGNWEKKISIDVGELQDLDILLVEDNAVNQKVARLILKRLGYQADVVSNGRQVLQALEKKDYDVILMDVQMPEMDGLEATKAILKMKLNRRPKILAMTAYALEGDREKCLQAGMDGYISKPVQIEELRSVLQNIQIQKKGLATGGEPGAGEADAGKSDANTRCALPRAE